MWECMNAATGDRVGEFDSMDAAREYRDAYLNPEWWYVTPSNI